MTLRQLWLTKDPEVVCKSTLKRRHGRLWKEFMRIRSTHQPGSSYFIATCLTTGLALCLTTQPASAASWLVHDMAEFATASASLQPGDEIVLADGTWTDARLLLKGQGTDAAPIVLRAQTPGNVILSGRSDLRLAGRYLQVFNLVFRNGYAPGDAVVAFRESSKAVASNSRVTGLVIDDYTNPDASDQDYWVSFYGSHNRLDHSQLRGKTNAGPTVVVVRDATQGLDNQHRIDHNWFGPRPALGVNGGETIRVGTSDTSLSDSNSTVENNWFEGCDGETEIISNKSGGNTYRGNVFYRSAGALTLRHGNGNRVIDNVFLGDDKAGTGGVRIINADQTVSNNYFERLAGSSNRSALAVMDAQADPPLSGYAPVVNATISRNTFVDVAKISFGVGHDEAKGIVVAASNSRFTGNLIVNRTSRNPPNAASSLAGISFSGNVQSPQASPVFPGGVEGRTITLQQSANDLWVPAPALPTAGADPGLAMTAREATGVDWYPKVGEVALSRTSTGVDR